MIIILGISLSIIIMGCSIGPKFGTYTITGVDPSRVCKGNGFVNWTDLGLSHSFSLSSLN